MRKVSFILLLIIASINYSSGQEESVIHYGASINPFYTHQVYEDAELGISKDRFGLSFGFDLFYDLNSRIELKTGINFHFKQINQIDYSPIFGCDFTENDPKFNSWFEDDYQLYYLGIPLESKFKIAGKENHLYIKPGLETLIKIGEKTRTIVVECKHNETEIQSNVFNETGRVLFLVKLGIGYEFKFIKKRKIYIEPQSAYSINGIFKEAGNISDLTNNSRIFYIGLLFGIKF